ncbi:MAG: hypothetical protein ED559_13120 [Phycisphaera sp.]|nr:MAG: hypothetical protein ED559_13120 [Phycisphaera sp.]
MTDARLFVTSFAIALCVTGCSEGYDKPSEVKVSRAITRSGDRIISYTAMYDDGIETYIDYPPHGEVDLITVERESESEGALLTLVRDGFELKSPPAQGSTSEAISDAWSSRFRYIDGLVDVDLVPWSDAHGIMTPREFDALEEGGSD